jgi:membrane-bound serine protease (ClpP class)
MRRLSLLVLTLLLVLSPMAASGQEDGPVVDVIDIGGVLDDSAIDFVIDRIEAAADRPTEAVIVQLDSRATVTDDVRDLVTLLQDAPVPVIVWVGPDPAVAYGGAVAILAAAPIGAAAPGVEIGYASQIRAGGIRVDAPAIVADTMIEVGDAPVPGLVDRVAPAINNLLVDLDGTVMTVRGEERVLTTVVEGSDGTTPVQTVFWEPGIGVRTLRLALTPEAAFFFLVVGLMVAAFEFYAIGPGIAAAVAASSLLISSYGLVVLPIRWWAVGLTLMGLWLMTVDYQRGGAGPVTGLGAIVLYLGGVYFTDAAPQLVPSWWIVLVIVISAVLWYVFAMTTVARARFSTPTIGRDHMIGRTGTAVTDFGPLGEVEVDGARWSATAHREAGLAAGDPIEVVGVDGRFLEVEPVVVTD